ncbi:MAG TPA: fibronectin type III domain-containing protein, partial [Flavobacterium sp.]
MIKILLKEYVRVLLLATLLLSAAHSNGQSIIAAWDFQTTSTGGTSAAVAPNSPTLFTANFGSGNLYLNGTNGSSTWITTTTGNELTAFGGTTVNTTGGLSTTTSGASALALLGGSGNSANGKSIVIKIDMTGFANLNVTYASQKTNTGFSTQTWEYSTNGTTWLPVQAVTSVTTSYSLITLNTITGLDNAPNAYLRFTGTGASSASGNNRLDNIQLRATAAPSGPTVTTLAASVSLPTEATLNGSVNANGTSTSISFQYGTSTSYGTSVVATPSTLATSVNTPVAATLTALSVNTQYHFRAVGTVGATPTNGNDGTFWTFANIPNEVIVNNPQATSLDLIVNSTTENGNPIGTQYAIREVNGSFLQANGTLGISQIWQTAADWSTITVTGLNSNTTYSFQVKARNGSNIETSFSSSASGTTAILQGANIIVTDLLNGFGNVCIDTDLTDSFTFDGSNLDGSDILISPLSGFTYSTDQNGIYTTSLVISYNGSSISGQTIWVKFSPVNVQSYDGNISLTGGGITEPESISATGSGINTSASSNTVAASNVTSTGAILNG